jgi:DNA-directed RNA polymerase subunit M/transcription elongation factor TFIIS
MPRNMSLPPEPAHPICPSCEVAMWMTQVEHHGSADEPQDHRIYECPICGSKTITPPLQAA